MSELAYEWQFRHEHGHQIDEDPPWPDEDATPKNHEGDDDAPPKAMEAK